MAGEQAPLTSGRDLAAPTPWNTWVDTHATATSDRRYGQDIDGLSGAITFGLDRKIGEDLAMGVSLSLDRSSTETFAGTLKSDTTGFTISPYLAVRLSPHWAIDASFGYGRADNDLSLSVLDGSFASHRYAGTITAHGQYKVGEYHVRPKLSASYAHFSNDSYNLRGVVLGLPLDVRLAENSFNYGVVQTSMELSRIYSFDTDTFVMPYAEVGTQYEFERPGSGQILTGDLSLATPSPWSALLRTGIRMLFSTSITVEANVGYMSFGQNGLNVWDGSVRVAYGF